MNKIFSKLLMVCVISVVLSGCAANTNMESFFRKEVDISYIGRVAVMPIQNNSKDNFVSERVRDMVITQILSRGTFDVVDKGLVDSALRDEAVNLKKAPMDNSVMKRLGQRLNVQAFMMGTIDNAEQVQRGAVSFPDLAITLRLVDVNTGAIFWQASGHRSGDSLGKRLFGLGSDDSFRVSMKLLKRLLGTIPTENTVVNESNQAGDRNAVSVDSGTDNGEVLPLDDAVDQASPDEIIDESASFKSENIDSQESATGQDDEIIFDSTDENNDLLAPDNSAEDADTVIAPEDENEEVVLPDFSGDGEDSADSIIDGSDGAEEMDLNDDNVEPDMIPPD